MAAIFSQVLNMSMTGSFVILLVMLARLMLKRSPKIFSYALWSAVLFRLLCPVAFTAPVSVLNIVQPEMRETSVNTSMVSYIPDNVDAKEVSSVSLEGQPAYQEAAGEPERFPVTPMRAAALVWASGAVGMLLYSVGQYLLLRRRLIGAMPLYGNIHVADHIDTAFVVGLFLPRIYLPSGVPNKERYYIFAHEQHHIRRFDHVIKLVAYLSLCIHWFNPLVWIAFVLAGRDMEMSCDEAVIRKLGPEIRADYSASLLRLATHKKILSGMPLAFGEGDTKGRVMNMAKWKKPKLWVSLVCMVLCAAVLAACAVNPEKVGVLGDPNADGPTSTFTTSQNGNSAQDSASMSGPVSVGLEDLHFTLPEGMSMKSAEIAHTGNAWDYGYTFYVGERTVGGIALRYQEQPNSPDSFSQKWQVEIGVPEASDASLGYMSGGSLYADYEITYFPDMPVNRDDNGNIIPDEQGAYVLEHEVTHYFFVNGKDVYDLWFYINGFPDIMRETLLKSCYMEGVTDIAAMQSALSEEKEVLEQCRSVLEQIQSSGAYKIETKQQNGSFALNETSIITAWGFGDDRLHICIIPESGGSSSVSGLRIADKKYECGTSQEWREITWWDWQDPWLASFQWDESTVAYLDTMTDENGTTVMLRIDQPYSVAEYEHPHYFVSFNFDADGSFRSVYVQANIYAYNGITKTESIVSLDPETVYAELQKEYQNAIAFLSINEMGAGAIYDPK